MTAYDVIGQFMQWQHTPSLVGKGLRTYTGEAIRVLGQVPVKVGYGQLTVLVIEGKGPNLMVKDWMRELKVTQVTLQGIHSIEEGSVLNEILKKHSSFH